MFERIVDYAKCFVVSLCADGLLASLNVSKQGQMKAIWGETRSQLMVLFSGINFGHVYMCMWSMKVGGLVSRDPNNGNPNDKEMKLFYFFSVSFPCY